MRFFSKVAKLGLVLGIVCSLFFIFPSAAEASGSDASTSSGAITFVRKATGSSSKEPADSSKDPGGKLPNMGELAELGLSIVGVILMFILVFVLWKRRKKEDEETD